MDHQFNANQIFNNKSYYDLYKQRFNGQVINAQ